MTYFIIADVHGFYSAMIKALKQAGFDKRNKNHTLVVLGDLFDRGFQPIECLDYVMSIPKKRRILIRGNHEDLLEDCIKRRYFFEQDIQNRTQSTVYLMGNDCLRRYPELPDIQNLGTFDRCERHTLLQKYLSECADYAEIGDDIFVHSWIPTENFSDGNWRSGDWKMARWVNPFEQWNAGLVPEGKTIYCGHWHTSWANHYYHNKGEQFGIFADFSPFVDKGIVGLDACTAYTFRVNVYKIEK